jgi:Domain of unknown function (DUF4041)/T5orf172 domain
VTMRFNPPPNWPTPPPGWAPPPGWKPDPAWPPPPDGWHLWLPADDVHFQVTPARRPPEAVSTSIPAMGAAASHPSVAALLARITELEAQLEGGVGIYRYHHPLENAALYKDRLAQLNTQVDEMVKAGKAVLAADMFTFNGSLAKGRKMVADLSRLMLRAYNAEADNCVRSLRSGNISTATRRLQAAMAAIEKLGAIMEMRVNPEYHALRVTELELTADYQVKIQEERERAREERELLREQRRAEAELAAEKERLKKERTHYLNALEALRSNGDEAAVEELTGRLTDIEKAIATNDFRITNIRAGYVYVISNIGAFGPNIVKIGMTRRLEPMDRVRELGGASVPFRYDVHALHFSDDAVTLEHELHKTFANRRVNVINERREFFFATPAEVREVLLEKTGGLLEYTERPEAPEYFQSVGRWPGQPRDAAMSARLP